MNNILLYKQGKEDISEIQTYCQTGGYESLKTCLRSLTPEQVAEEVKISGLRGRGGAGFPTGLKWSFLDKKSQNPRYLVCNFDESEPGTFKDHYLVKNNPHILLEGIIISAFALQANTAYIYIRGELFYILRKLEKAIEQAYHSGFLGENILGSGFNLNLYCHPGAGAYICGEETALLESLEGKRGNPRMKPPFPAVSGLYESPTVVNNVETLANIPWITRNGGAAYARIGTEKSTGTKLISACGHINNPGVYEIEMGLSVKEFLYSDQYCGGIRNGNILKAVIAGGSSVPILPAQLILNTAAGEERLLSYESLSEGGFQSGSMLGSGGFIVLDHTACVVKNLLTFARFYHHESCGQCSPCREGTSWMDKILTRIENGKGSIEEIDLLYSIAGHIEGNTICPLGDAAAWPVASAIRHFRSEFEEHIKLHRCPYSK